MRIPVLALLMILLSVHAMEERCTVICSFCSLPLDSNIEKIVGIGCAEDHLFHGTCIRALLKDYDKENGIQVCPIASCEGYGDVDRYGMYIIEKGKKRKIFKRYQGLTGKWRWFKDFVKEGTYPEDSD